MSRAKSLRTWAVLLDIAGSLQHRALALQCSGIELCVRGAAPCVSCREAWALGDAAEELHRVWMRFDHLLPGVHKG